MKVQRPNRIAIPKEVMELEVVKPGDMLRVSLEKVRRK